LYSPNRDDRQGEGQLTLLWLYVVGDGERVMERIVGEFKGPRGTVRGEEYNERGHAL
jgi:hypothetical protein